MTPRRPALVRVSAHGTAHAGGGTAHRCDLARRQLPVGRADLPARQPAAARAAAAGARQAAAARALGHHPGPELPLRAHEPRDPASATSTRSSSPARATAGRRWSPAPGSRAATARSTRRCHATRRACASCSGASPSPAAIPSHVAPETPGSIHEGGELGYALAHAYGAAFDNPDLLVLLRGRRRRGGDRGRWPRAGTATSSSTPSTTATVLPVLHLNGYKIANPTVLARIPHDELRRSWRATGTGRSSSRATSRRRCTRGWPRRWTRRSTRSRRSGASTHGDGRPRWPMIVLRTPKGWTGPKQVDGLPTEGTWRSHQVPLAEHARQPGAPGAARGVAALATDRRSCSTRRRARARTCSRPSPGRRAADGRQPARQRRAAAARTCGCPTSATTPSRCRSPPPRTSEATRVLGTFLRDVDARATRTRSGSSGRTRRRRTGSARCSR